MSNIDRYGIARDDEGKLDDFLEWAWFWRYGIGAAVIVASIAWWYFMEQRQAGWMTWVIPAIGVIYALILMREAGCLALIAGVSIGGWMLCKAIFPSMNTSVTLKELVVIVALFAVGWMANLALEASNSLKREVARLSERLSRVEGSNFDDHPTGIAGLQARIAELEEKLKDDPDGLNW